MAFRERSFVIKKKQAGVILASFALIGAALVGFDTSCTLVTARTDGQCFNDSECTSRPGFANSRCSATGTCEAIVLPEAGADAGGACTTNLDCNLRFNKKARCASGQCEQITNPSCTVVDGDPTNDAAIFVGVMTPQSGVNLPYGQNQYGVVKAAAAEWLRGVAGQTGTHPFVTIGCDELVDPAGTAAFLAHTVQTSAIFGPIYDADFELALPAATANGKLILSPRADDLKLSTLDGMAKNGWSWAPNRAIQAKYFNNLVAAIEPSVRSKLAAADAGADAGGPDMKVVFAVADDPSSTNFADAVEQTLTFNGGKTTAQNGANYARQAINFSFSAANDYTAAVAALQTTPPPDLVIVAQEYDLLAFVRAVNSGWGGSKFPRFLFLTEDGGVENELHLPSERFAGKVDFVTWSRSAQEIVNATTFATAFRSTGVGDPADRSESLYDAFYENAYVFQSVLDHNNNSVPGIDSASYITGITLMNGPGTPINVGSAGIPTMLTLLAAGGTPDLDGASGPLNFDKTQGSPIQDAVLECIKADGTVTPSGITFAGSTGAAAGSYTCL